MPTRLIVYELAAWLPTSTPSGGLTGSEVGDAAGLAGGALVAVAVAVDVACALEFAEGEAERLATLLLLPPPHAATSSVATRATFMGVEGPGDVPIRKGNDIL